MQPRHNPFGILMYHRIAPRIPAAPAPTWNVTPWRFREQMQGLLARGYQAWPLRRALECHRMGEPIPKHVFVVTFDDGYENVFLNARPILKELGIPATVFVATAYLGTDAPFPFDDWSAAGAAHVPSSAWKAMTFAQCAALLDEGLLDIGSHTHTHGDFRGQPDAFRRDLQTSLDVLRDKLGLEGVTFAFPYGFYGPQMGAIVRELGACCALTTERRLVASQSDPFDWGRIFVAGNDTPGSLALKLHGWHASVRYAMRWFRRPWQAACRWFGQGHAPVGPAATKSSAPNGGRSR